MAYEPYICNLDSETKKTLKIYLFKDIQNVDEIRSNIMNGSWKCTVIKPSLVLDVFQIAVAANKAALAEKNKGMITRSVYSEILYNMSMSKNITKSMITFGIESDQNLLVCLLVTGDNDDCEDIITQIKGDLCPISDLPNFTNMEELKNVYKLNNLTPDIDLFNVIIAKMVTKSFVSH